MSAKVKGRKAASRKKEAAARSEKGSKAKVVEFRGLKLKMPSKLPLSLAFKWREIQKDSDGDQFAILGLLEALLGKEQYEAVERKIDEDGLTVDDDAEVLFDLINGVMGAFGTSPGE